ncbi:MAG: chlorite dismutase family protein [Acidobacteriota bacterium]
MTKRSQYVIGHEHEGQADSRGFLRLEGQKYIFLDLFCKTRTWYVLPRDERQRLMTEHIRVGHPYPRVKPDTTFPFGLDDQEYVAFETNYAEDFLDLVKPLRGHGNQRLHFEGLSHPHLRPHDRAGDVGSGWII